MLTSEAATQIDRKQYDRLCELVHRHCGITLNAGKLDLVKARIARELRGTSGTSVTEYLDQVMSDPAGEPFAKLIDALSTNLTSFFRESSHFTYLTDVLLPKAMDRQRRARTTRLRGWSAACSTGEEPYTLAVTLLEALAGKGAWDARLLATDISRNVLRTAVAGQYDAARVRSVPAPLRDKYFAPVAGGGTGRAAKADRVQVSAEVRAMVTFNYLNLIDPWPFTGPFDFIFCRNVMIYFDAPTQERLVGRFWNCLEPGGVLFTGHSESLTGIRHKFRYVQPSIYLKA